MVTTKTQLEVLDDAAGKLNRTKVARDEAAANVESAKDDLKSAETTLAQCESRLEAARNQYEEVLAQ